MGQRRQCLKWRRRLVCSQCGNRNVDMVVTGTRRAMPATALEAAEQGAGMDGDEVMRTPVHSNDL
jgi:hypothetical protein